MSENLLEMREITKRFPGVTANDGVSFDLREGEIHALVGENGAGKTTLMKILYGLHRPDSGSILVRGSPVAIRGPREAIRLGIGMVHQHFMLFPPFSVLEMSPWEKRLMRQVFCGTPRPGRKSPPS